jgi:pilus assembly protein CpaE
MKDKISFAVLSLHESTRAAIAQGLAGTGAIRVVADGARPEELEHALQSAAQIGIYVDLAGEPEKALCWIEALTEPKPPVLAGGPPEPSLILRAMRAGALAYFPEHQFDEELGRVASRLQEAAAAETPPKAGSVLAVLGVKGGVGCTTVAAELAASLARGDGRVALVDAKAYFGDIALRFDVTPAYTLADVAARANDLDGSFLATVAHRHDASNVHIVAAPASPEEADGVEGSHIERSVELLRTEFDWVVIDLPRITDEAALQVLDKADVVVLVTTSDVPSLVRARQHVSLLDQLGHGEDKRRVVANRARRPGWASEGDPLRAVGLEPVAYIPDDPDAMEGALASGRPASMSGQKNGVASAFARLVEEAHAWCGVEREEKQEEEPASLRYRLEGTVRNLRCRLAIG